MIALTTEALHVCNEVLTEAVDCLSYALKGGSVAVTILREHKRAYMEALTADIDDRRIVYYRLRRFIDR